MQWGSTISSLNQAAYIAFIADSGMTHRAQGSQQQILCRQGVTSQRSSQQRQCTLTQQRQVGCQVARQRPGHSSWLLLLLWRCCIAAAAAAEGWQHANGKGMQPHHLQCKTPVKAARANTLSA
jgi:hypothetical protein